MICIACRQVGALHCAYPDECGNMETPMRCEVCKRGPMDGVTVFRQNAKGQPGVWRCEEHSKPIDPELYRDVAMIEARDPGRKHN